MPLSQLNHNDTQAHLPAAKLTAFSLPLDATAPEIYLAAPPIVEFSACFLWSYLTNALPLPSHERFNEPSTIDSGRYNSYASLSSTNKHRTCRPFQPLAAHDFCLRHLPPRLPDGDNAANPDWSTSTLLTILFLLYMIMHHVLADKPMQ